MDCEPTRPNVKGEQSLLKPLWKETNESCRPKKQTAIHHSVVQSLHSTHITCHLTTVHGRTDRHDARTLELRPHQWNERMILSLSSLWQANPYRPRPCRGQSDGLESVHWLEIRRKQCCVMLILLLYFAAAHTGSLFMTHLFLECFLFHWQWKCLIKLKKCGNKREVVIRF